MLRAMHALVARAAGTVPLFFVIAAFFTTLVGAGFLLSGRTG